MVESIRRIGMKLEFGSFSEGKLANDGDVHVFGTRKAQVALGHGGSTVGILVVPICAVGNVTHGWVHRSRLNFKKLP